METNGQETLIGHKLEFTKLTDCLRELLLSPLLPVKGFDRLLLVRSLSSDSRSGRRERRRLRCLSSGSTGSGSSGSEGKCHSTTGMRHATKPTNRMKKNILEATMPEISGKRETIPLDGVKASDKGSEHRNMSAYRIPWWITTPRMNPDSTDTSRPRPSPMDFHWS